MLCIRHSDYINIRINQVVYGNSLICIDRFSGGSNGVGGPFCNTPPSGQLAQPVDHPLDGRRDDAQREAVHRGEVGGELPEVVRVDPV